MAAPDAIVELVEKFRANEQEYMQANFVEMQAREEFINPFFIALGWDVGDRAGLGPARCDVRLEETIRAADVRQDSIAAVVGKRPDYSFRIEGKRKFYVEAKKPHEDIERNRAHAFQVRAYGWSANLDISILTDFQELSIYNCKVPPVVGDAASTALLPGFHMTYGQYAERWDEIEALLHREAVAGGSLEKYVEKEGQKRGVLTVDAAFLKDISDWRSRLALDIARRNPRLSQRDLNYAVQMIINRIIFLRICEDRGIEPLERLKGAATRPSEATYREGHVYRELVGLFHRADERYNSGLFHFQQESGRHEHADTFTLGLNVGDDVLITIISHLYHPYPYKFDAMPVEILGQVYEQFLGKVIVKQPDGVVAVEDKPEVRKAGGVYYTPTYIVDYIVGQTVGKLVDGKTPEQVGKLRVLDPACGSGSFLIGAYQYLLDWHLNYYLEHGPEQFVNVGKKKSKPLEKVGGEWRLTIDERKRILRNNIYGVDIDTQAVEVTKLSLLLKVLEGETESTLGVQRHGVQTRLVDIERVLPDLGDNIKAGNSLIGPDFYETVQMGMFPEDEMQRINVFDWHGAFPQIMGAGGFDAVIGNPPYVRMEGFKELKGYLKAKYASHDERADLYAYFIERAQGLLAQGGRFGMIVSNKFLRANYGKPLRGFLYRNASIVGIVDLAGLPVFLGATVRTIILLTSKHEQQSTSLSYSPPFDAATFSAVASGSLSVEAATARNSYEVATAAIAQSVWSFSQSESEDFLVRVKSTYAPLGLYCEGQIYMGIKSGYVEAFAIDANTRRSIIADNPEADEIIKPFLNGRDVRRYNIQPTEMYLIYTYHGVNIGSYPRVEQHLLQFKDRLERRATKQEWYELQQPQYRFRDYMAGIKIIFPDIAISPRFALDEVGYYSANTTYFIPGRDLYLLGLLNSQFGYFYFRQTCAGLEGKNETYLRFFGQYLEGFPVRTINFSDPADKQRHDRMVQLVETMLDLHKRLQAANTPYDKASIETRIKYTDTQIDRLVYELYGLTEEEIAIVEGGE